MMQEQEEGSRQNLQGQQQQQQPWWFKWLQKTACVLAGIICAILGVVVLVTVHATCILAGVFQIMLGALVVILEAPCCCAYLDFIDKITKFSDSRPAWQKAVIYCGLPVVPVALCQGVSCIIGNVLIFACGLSFIFVALGRKATREEMLSTARGEPESGSKSGLVDNAQPIAQSKPPQYNNIV